MKALSRLAWILALVATLTGCAKLRETFGRLHGGTTRVRIATNRNHNQFSPNAVLTAGLMVYAVGSDGTQTAVSLLDETMPLSFLLPNGAYTFLATGWDTSPISGAIRCGLSSQYTLTGVDTEVYLSMSPADCAASGQFAPAAAYNSGNLLPLQVVFCANGTDISGMGGAGDCTGGLQSAMFAKGNTSASMTEGEPFTDLGLMVFTANPVNATAYELYVTPLDGSAIETRLSPPPPAGSTGVEILERVPNSHQAIFVMNEGSGPRDLWLVDLDEFEISGSVSSSVKKISHSSPVGSNGVKDFRISPDGAYVVFVSDALSNGNYDLFSVPLAGPTYPAPTKISGTRTGGATGVRLCGSCGGKHKWIFEINPETNTPFVVYSSMQDYADRTDLYIASLDGGSVATGASTINGTGVSPVASGTRVSGAEGITGTVADRIGFTADGLHVAYHVNSGGGDAIYALDAALNTATSTLVTSVTTLAAANAYGSYFTVSNTSSVIAYYTKPAGVIIVTYVDLADVAGSTHPIYDIPEYGITNARFAPDDSHLVIAANDISFVPVHVFSLQLNPAPGANYPAGIYFDYSGLLNGTQQIYATRPSGGENFQIDSTGTYLLYSSDQNGTGMVELFYSTLGTAGSTAISGSGILAAGNSVTSYYLASGGDVYFAAGIDSGGHPELYSTTIPSPPPNPTRLMSDSEMGDLEEVMGSADGTDIYLKAASPGNVNAKEAWTYTPGLTSPFTRLTPMPDTSPVGIGRVQISVMEYGIAAGGVAPAFQSNCLSYQSGGTDGSPFKDNTAPLMVPVGPAGGGNSPLAIAVDVYPLSTTCTGTYVRYFFADSVVSGIPNVVSRVVGDGAANLKLFIADQ